MVTKPLLVYRCFQGYQTCASMVINHLSVDQQIHGNQISIDRHCYEGCPYFNCLKLQVGLFTWPQVWVVDMHPPVWSPRAHRNPQTSKNEPPTEVWHAHVNIAGLAWGHLGHLSNDKIKITQYNMFAYRLVAVYTGLISYVYITLHLAYTHVYPQASG